MGESSTSGSAPGDRVSSSEPRIYELDGARCTSLEAFFAELDLRLGLGFWSHELDALGAALRGRLEPGSDGFVVRWSGAREARTSLGYPATIAYLEAKRRAVDPEEASAIETELAEARRLEGQTLFERVLEVFEARRPEGVELELVW